MIFHQQKKAQSEIHYKEEELSITNVGVVGCGLMGSGIAEVAAKSGFKVTVREMNSDLWRQDEKDPEVMDRAVEKEKLTPEERDAAWECLTFVTALEDIAHCDIVIEAIVESLELKNALFSELDELSRLTHFCV